MIDKSADKIRDQLFNLGSSYERELVAYLERLYGELSEDLVIAVVFVSLFRKAGHVCLPLELPFQEWVKELELDRLDLGILPNQIDISAIENSRITGQPGEMKPLILDKEKRLYIHKMWSFESIVAERIGEISSKSVKPSVNQNIHKIIDNLFQNEKDNNEPDFQKIAAIASLFKKIIVLSGGPGTGKTTTIAKLLALQFLLHGANLRVILAAPTGKAAARLSEALSEAKQNIPVADGIRELIPVEAVTLHRLLYPYRKRGLFPETKEPLPYDLIVVDEASMMDLTLTHNLLANMHEDASLILVGDKDQLASVEAGAVLGDICIKKRNGFSSKFFKTLSNYFPEAVRGAAQVNGSILNDSVIYLEKNYRFGSKSGIGNLAVNVNQGDGEEAWNVIAGDVHKDVRAGMELDGGADFTKIFEEIFQSYSKASKTDSPEEALTVWLQSVWMTAYRYKNPGVVQLNREFEKYLVLQKKIYVNQELFEGKPILVTKNDYSTDLFNGDLGVIKKIDGIYKACFKSEDGSIKFVSISQIVHYEPAWFWTVHKSQGSQFDTVHLLLPEGDSPILSKELVYTAVTRAKNRFIYHGKKETLIKAVSKSVHRFSGLSDKLKNLELREQ